MKLKAFLKKNKAMLNCISQVLLNTPEKVSQNVYILKITNIERFVYCFLPFPLFPIVVVINYTTLVTQQEIPPHYYLTLLLRPWLT